MFLLTINSFEYLNENLKSKKPIIWNKARRESYYHHKGKGPAPIVPQGYAICYRPGYSRDRIIKQRGTILLVGTSAAPPALRV